MFSWQKDFLSLDLKESYRRQCIKDYSESGRQENKLSGKRIDFFITDEGHDLKKQI